MLDRLTGILQGRDLLQRVIRNTAWQVTDKIIRLGLGLVVSAWVARYLGPADFGLLNFGIAFVAIFTPFADGGLQAIAVRELIRRPTDEATIIASGIALRLIGAVVAVAISVACVAMLRPDAAQAHLVVLIVALSLFPQSWDLIDFAYQARMRPRPIVIIRVTSLLVFSIAKIVLILIDAPVLSFAWVIVGEAALSALLMWLLSSVRSRSFRIRDARWMQMKTLITMSWPMAISGLSVMLYMRIDQVMLGKLVGDHAVGAFSAAVRISECWYFVPMAIMASVAPALTEAHQRSPEEYLRKLSAISSLMWLLGIGVAAVLSLTANPVIALLFGPDYSEAGVVLAIHAWAGVFVCQGLASGPWFVNAGMLRLRMVNTVVGAICNVLLNLTLIPHMGVTGAAVATLVSYCVAGILMNAATRQSRPVFFVQLRSLVFR
jgi:PST family polysaccharide transporter